MSHSPTKCAPFQSKGSRTLLYHFSIVFSFFTPKLLFNKKLLSWREEDLFLAGTLRVRKISASFINTINVPMIAKSNGEK